MKVALMRGIIESNQLADIYGDKTEHLPNEEKSKN